MRFRKTLALLLSLAMLASLAACGGGKDNSDSSGSSSSSSSSSSAPAVPTLKEGVTLQQIIDEVSEEYEFSMPGAADEQLMTDLVGMDLENVEEYAGNITLTMTSADNLIAVKAKEGKVEEVQKTLEDRLDYVRQSFEQYLPEQKEKAAAGKVFTVGDYVFLVIMGRMDQDPAGEVSAIQEKIGGYFNQ